MELQIKIAEVTSANIAKASTSQVVFMSGGGSGDTGAKSFQHQNNFKN